MDMLLTIVRIVEICDLLPAIESNGVYNRLMVVGSHADGKVQKSRGRGKHLQGIYWTVFKL